MVFFKDFGDEFIKAIEIKTIVFYGFFRAALFDFYGFKKIVD